LTVGVSTTRKRANHTFGSTGNIIRRHFSAADNAIFTGPNYLDHVFAVLTVAGRFSSQGGWAADGFETDRHGRILLAAANKLKLELTLIRLRKFVNYMLLMKNINLK